MYNKVLTLLSVFLKLKFRDIKENRIFVYLIWFIPILFFIFLILEIFYYSKLDQFYQKTLFNFYFLTLIILIVSSAIKKSIKLTRETDDVIDILPIKSSSLFVYNCFKIFWYNKWLYLLYLFYFFTPFWLFNSVAKYLIFIISLTFFSFLINMVVFSAYCYLNHRSGFNLFYKIVEIINDFVVRLMYLILFSHIIFHIYFINNLKYIDVILENNSMRNINDLLYKLIFSNENIAFLLVVLIINAIFLVGFTKIIIHSKSFISPRKLA